MKKRQVYFLPITILLVLGIGGCGKDQPPQSSAAEESAKDDRVANEVRQAEMQKANAAAQKEREELKAKYPYRPYVAENKTPAGAGTGVDAQQIEKEREKNNAGNKYTSLDKALIPKPLNNPEDAPKPLWQHPLSLFADQSKLDQLSGAVTIEYVIDADGSVVRALVLSNTTKSPEIEKIAVHAVSQWKFEKNDGPYITVHIFTFSSE